jgi:hypothetical protein
MRLADGAWKTLRLHMRQGLNSDSRFDVWVPELNFHWYEEGWTEVSTVEGFNAILFGRNKDKGQNTGTESIWVGRCRVYTVDPGW